VPKIVSECCEFVKLCHINRNGPVFFETQCSYSVVLQLRCDMFKSALSSIDHIYRDSLIQHRDIIHTFNGRTPQTLIGGIVDNGSKTGITNIATSASARCGRS